MKSNRDGTLERATGKRGLRGSDIAIILVVILVAVGLYVGTRGIPFSTASAQGEDSTSYAVVQNTEGVYEVLPLNNDTEVEFVSSKGENHVVVQDGAVCIDEADCKNQICVQSGWIDRVGDTIVCLPHDLVVQVVAHPEDAAPVQGLLG